MFLNQQSYVGIVFCVYLKPFKTRQEISEVIHSRETTGGQQEIVVIS